MSKKQQTRGIDVKNQVAIENTIVEDEHLLPSAEELEKLQRIDPDIILWIKQRTEQEQNARLKINAETMRFAHRDLGITQTSLWLAFILAIVIFALSALFIYMGKEIAGTVFGGVGILTVIQAFLKFGRNKSNETKNDN